jgi:NADPH-dependent ferric siderophore reductase
VTPPSEHATAFASRLDGVVAVDLRVTDASWILPGLRELRTEGDLTTVVSLPGQDVMVSVPLDQGGSKWRRYTMRRVDRDAGTLDLWVATDSEGPGARWALGAQIGDALEIVGPRGKVFVDPTASTHFFVVDTAGLAAMCAMIESIDAPSTVHALVVLEAEPELLTVDLAARNDGVTGVTTVTHERAERPDPEWLATHVRAALTPVATTPGGLYPSPYELHWSETTFDPTTTAAYVFAEFAQTRRAAAVFAEFGLDPSRVHAKPYWRAGEANQDHGEPDKTEH